MNRAEIADKNCYTNYDNGIESRSHAECQTADNNSCGTCFRRFSQILSGFGSIGCVVFRDDADNVARDETTENSNKVSDVCDTEHEVYY